MDILSPGTILCYAVQLYVIAIFVRIILSWFPIDPDGAVAPVAGFLHMITEPVLRPVRALMPAVRMGNVALDLSPMIVLLVVQLLVVRLVC